MSVSAGKYFCVRGPTLSVSDLLKIAVMTSRRAYRSDLSRCPVGISRADPGRWRAARAEAGLGLSEPVHDLREIVNAILYVNWTGIAWEYLPHDFPPFKTVYDYYAKWEADGTTEVIHDELRRKVRKAAGRSAEPSAAILDAQSIRTSGNVPESSQGIDAGKKSRAGRGTSPPIRSACSWSCWSPRPACRTRPAAGTWSASRPPATRAWSGPGGQRYKRSVIERGAGTA